MSRFSEEMKVIPRLAWTIAVVIALIVPFVAFGLASLSVNSGEQELIPLVVLIGLAVAVTIFVYILIMGYIAGDSRRRGMRPVLWVLLAIFTPSAIGIILYFILREPLLQNCPKCGARTRPGHAFCPTCGESLSMSCPGCRSAIQREWSHCVHCGVRLH